MPDVAIIGTGMIPVGEHWNKSLRELAAEAVHAALDDARVYQPDALYVGNAFGSVFTSQSHLGALIADFAGLRGIEAFSIDAADASGGAALRTAVLAICSGLVETVVVVGAEKSSDAIAEARIEARSVALDADFESVHGATLPALAALLMRRYMHEYGLGLRAFEGFSINAHANGQRNPYAMYRNTMREGTFAAGPMMADPVSLFDSAPDADGAAALVLTSAERAREQGLKAVHIVGSAVATDAFALQTRENLLFLDAAARSIQTALQQACIEKEAVDLFELHDAFTILSALTLEAAGYAARGEGWRMVDEIGLDGSLPISSFGGLKSRGNPVGATGVYQAVEAALQLRGEAGDNQVQNARIAMIQNLGSIGSTAITHILRADS